MSFHSCEWRGFTWTAQAAKNATVQAISRDPSPTTTTPLGYALFATRWLQAPLYFGLVAAQGVYVYKFFNELWTLVLRCVTGRATETYVMLAVLKLVDVVMIANLLIMVIVGGYETFVSRIGLQGHRDQPEWLSHVNSNVLKVKLATAIVGISSVHLLQMFVDVHHTSRHALLWGTVIHMAFIVSAAILAYMSGPMAAQSERASHQVHQEPAPEAAPSPKVFVPAQGGSRDDDAPSAERRLRAAGFPSRKLLEDFDSDHPHSFDRETVARLGKLDFVTARRNVVFVGPPGTGKTHLAVGLGVRACQAGHSVLFATAEEWAARLAGARDAGRLAEELTALDDHPVLIVDEVGYTPFDAGAAGLFFQLIAHRYERSSLIVTSDRPLGRWDEIFGGPSALAMVDRLAHHAELVRIDGESYRMRRATSAWAD
ncbi:uncharacterized protein (TIGR00645 family) [Streptomyces sp. V4I8]